MCGEVREIREYTGEVRGGYAEPLRQSCAVLIDRGRGNPPAIAAHVAGTSWSKDRQCSVDVASGHGAAHHHLHTTPGMIAAAVRGWLVGATEVRHGEGSDLLGEVQLDGSAVEGAERRT